MFVRKDRLRVVVSTANFTRGGWKHQRNHLWSMDFPVLPDSVPLDALLSCNSSFGDELAAYMSNLLAPCAPSESDASLHRVSYRNYSCTYVRNCNNSTPRWASGSTRGSTPDPADRTVGAKGPEIVG